VTAALAVAAAVLLAAGCGPVNRGSDLADRMEQELRGLPGVESVSAGGQNLLPWAGTAHATVVLRPDATTDDLLALVDRAHAWSDETDGDASVTVEQQVHDATTSLVLAAGVPVDAGLLAVRDEAAALLPGGVLELRQGGRGRTGPGVASTSALTVAARPAADDAALPVAQALAAVAGLGAADLSVQDAGGATLRLRPASSSALAVLHDLAAQGVTVTTAEVRDRHAVVHVPAEQARLAERVAAGSGFDVAVVVPEPVATTAPVPVPSPSA
jgi:hypothetical protein